MNRLDGFSIFDNLFDATIAIDVKGDFYYGNEAFANLCGISLRQILKKKNIKELFSVNQSEIFQPDNLSQVATSTPYIEVGFESTTGKNGKVQISMQAVQTESGQKRILIFFRDATMEEKLHGKYRSELTQKDAKIAEISLLLDISNALTGINDSNTVYGNVATKLLAYNVCDFVCHLNFSEKGENLEVKYFGRDDDLRSFTIAKAVLEPYRDLWHGYEFKLLKRENYKNLFNIFGAKFDIEEQSQIALLPIQTTRFRGGSLLLFIPANHSVNDAESLHFLKSVTSQTGVALESAQFFEHSITDEMTGFYNKRYLFTRLNEEIERANRVGEDLTTIIFDIDYFKDVNDRYGHQSGDVVIKKVAHAVRNLCRKYDIPCRYGGDEFVLTLPNTKAEGALLLAERIRKKVEGMSNKFSDTEVKVTLSIGIASYPHNAKDLDELIAAADKALYFAKKSGRNQSKVYDKDCESILASA